jgi:hypothetical protein
MKFQKYSQILIHVIFLKTKKLITNFKTNIMASSNQMGNFITLDEASEMTAHYRETIQPGETIAYAISKDFISQILNQTGCEGLRFYYGLNNDGEKTLVITGIDNAGNDMYNGLIADGVWKCPSICSARNSLNS